MADRSGRILTFFAAAWLIAAIAYGFSGVLERLPVRAVPITIVTLTLLAVGVLFAVPQFRRWAMSVDVRLLVALHVTRFVGIAFLIYERRGLLPSDFARAAGWGDIAVAVTALLVISVLSVPMPRRPRSLIAWNIFGFADFVMVMVRAMHATTVEPGSLLPMLRLPMSLLPTFLVPLLFAIHVVLFVRIWRERKEFMGQSTPDG